MDEKNPPFYLPSGYLVSQNALDKISEIVEEDDEQITYVRCPVTKGLFKKTELRKVFFSWLYNITKVN